MCPSFVSAVRGTVLNSGEKEFQACSVMLAASCLQFHRRDLRGSSHRPMHSRLSFLFRFVINLGLFGTRVPGSLENSLIMRNLTAINWMPIPVSLTFPARFFAECSTWQIFQRLKSLCHAA